MLQVGYSAVQLRAAGFGAVELRHAGMPHTKIKSAGYSAEEVAGALAAKTPASRRSAASAARELAAAE